MPELATREFWKDLQPIPDCFKPDAKPEVYLRNAPTEDERLYVPFTETVKSRPLWISPSENRWCDILMATSAGLVNRHYHPHEVFAYTISGKWGYLEHDWTATAGDLGLVGFLVALRRPYFAVLQVAAFLVAAVVERGDHFLAELRAFAEDRIDHVRRGFGAVDQVAVMLGEIEDFVEQEARVAQRGFVNGHGYLGDGWRAPGAPGRR